MNERNEIMGDDIDDCNEFLAAEKERQEADKEFLEGEKMTLTDDQVRDLLAGFFGDDWSDMLEDDYDNWAIEQEG